MYIPKRLQKNLKLINEKCGTNVIIKGEMYCCEQCGFCIMYVGDLKKNLLGQQFIIPKKETLLITANCRICGKEIRVFDSHTDGYHRLWGNTVSPQVTDLTSFSCSKCGGIFFSVELRLEYQPRDDLEADGIYEHEDSFSWIWISLTCAQCKKHYRDIVDMETS